MKMNEGVMELEADDMGWMMGRMLIVYRFHNKNLNPDTITIPQMEKFLDPKTQVVIPIVYVVEEPVVEVKAEEVLGEYEEVAEPEPTPPLPLSHPSRRKQRTTSEGSHAADDGGQVGAEGDSNPDPAGSPSDD